MKKVITLVLGTVIASTSFAQLSIGVHATGILSDTKVKTEDMIDMSQSKKITPGGGVTVEYGFSSKFSLRSGISYLQHGSKFNMEIPGDNTDPISIKTSINNQMHYLHLPVIAMYKVPLEKLTFFVGAGPYMNFGIKAQSKLKAVYSSPLGVSTMEETKNLFKKDEDGNNALKRTDLGITAIAGVKLNNGMFANLGYQLGISNNVKDGTDSFKNRGLQLTIGYFFK